VWQPAIRYALVVLLVIHGLVLGPVGLRPAVASVDPNWPGIVLCQHDAVVPLEQPPPGHPDSGTHCDFCIAGAVHALAPLPFSLHLVLVAVEPARSPPTELHIPRSSAGDPSARPRGPPQTA